MDRPHNDAPTAFLDDLALSAVIAEAAEEIPIQRRNAYSSPGFLELLIPAAVGAVPVVTMLLIFRSLSGKARSEDGKELLQGIPALLQSASNLFNDKVSRDARRAETRRTDAQTQRILAETRLILANAEKQERENRLQAAALDAQERAARIEPVLIRLGIAPPEVKLPDNAILFPVRKEP